MKLNITDAKELNPRLNHLLDILGLSSADSVLLSYTKEDKFEAEADSCHLNVWIKFLHDAGLPLFGWKLGHDEKNEFVEAQFHSIWKSTTGCLVDLTPRKNSSVQILFVPDPTRQISLYKDGDLCKMNSYDNVRIHRNKVITGVQRIRFTVHSPLIKKYALDEKW